MRRNNGIPASTNVTNRQNVDGTFTRTTETLYNDGNEITTKETMTATEIQQVEDDGVAAASSSSSRRSLLRETLDDLEWDSPLFRMRRANAIEENSFVIICIKAMQQHFSGNPSYFKSLVALSFVCLFTIIGLLKCIINTGHHYDGCMCKGGEENVFTFISLLLSYIVIFMIYRAGSNYKEKSEEDTSPAASKEKDDWFLRWISNLAWASVFVSCYISYVVVSSSLNDDRKPVHTDIQLALTMWNLMTASFMIARTEYLRRRSLNDTLYIRIATAGTVGKSSFFWVVSLISGCLCGVCYILFDTDTRKTNEMMYFPVSAITLLYVISANVAIPLMLYRRYSDLSDEKSNPVQRNESEMLVVLIDESKRNETTKPISYLFVVSILMSAVGILLSIVLSQLVFDREHPIFEDYFGFVIWAVVGWNSIPWVLMKRHLCLPAEDIIKEQKMIKSCILNCPQAKV